MKLAIIVCGKSPTTMPGGLGSYSYNIARIFHASGYTVHLLGYGDSDGLSVLEFGHLYELRNPFRKLVSFGNFFITGKMIKKTCEIIDRNAATEVVIFGAAIWGKVAVAAKEKYAHRPIRIRTIVSYFTTYRHEYAGQVRGAPVADYGLFYNISLRLLLLFTSMYHSRQEAKVLAGIDRIIVHYDSTARILVEEFPRIDMDKIRKIPYYVEFYDRDSTRQNFSSSRTTKTRIVSICRHDPRKGINTLLKAVRLLHDAGHEFECVIAGSGFFRHKHVQLAEKLGLEKLVLFPGFITSSEELLMSSDIFVISSLEEGSGAVALLEAMQCAMPIVATKCDGIPEDLVHRESALLVEMDNARQMADALALLINDIALREQIGARAKQEYAQRFSFSKMKDGLDKCLS